MLISVREIATIEKTTNKLLKMELDAKTDRLMEMSDVEVINANAARFAHRCRQQWS